MQSPGGSYEPSMLFSPETQLERACFLVEMHERMDLRGEFGETTGQIPVDFKREPTKSHSMRERSFRLLTAGNRVWFRDQTARVVDSFSDGLCVIEFEGGLRAAVPTDELRPVVEVSEWVN